MNRILLLFFLPLWLLSFSDCAWYFAEKVPANNVEAFLNSTDKSPKRFVVFLGDSITHAGVSHDYVSDLAQNPSLKRFTMVNEGINSRLTYQILEKLEDTIRLNPEHIFILIGTNDLLASLSEEEFEEYQELWKLKEVPTLATYERNLNKIVSILKKGTQAKLHLISIPPLGENLESIPLQKTIEYRDIMKKTAEEYEVSYLPLNETLIRELRKYPNQDSNTYYKNTPLIYWVIFKRYTFFQSWDSLSDQSGNRFMTDNIHLNARAGKILEEMIQEELLK